VEDAADHAAIILSLRARPVLGKVGLDRGPRLIADPVDAFHARLLRFYRGVILDLLNESMGCLGLQPKACDVVG
jgi:hypothetical protein